MKPIIMTLSVAIGVAWGIFPSIYKPKPRYWKIITIILMVFAFAMNLIPPVATDYFDLKIPIHKFQERTINIVSESKPEANVFDQGKNLWRIFPASISMKTMSAPIIFRGSSLPEELKSKNLIVFSAKYDSVEKNLQYISTVSINPTLVYPYIPSLEEKVRILNFHVPLAWVAVLAFLLSMIFSVRYLKSGNFDNDTFANACVSLGFIFTILATVTGMVWAKFNWGSFWNWDPRETSVFVLLIIYSAYLGLRSALDNPELRARLSAVYSIIAFITVPFFIFILPRITMGLHPGASGGDSGPLIGQSGKSMLDSGLLLTFGISFTAVTITFFWMLNLKFRLMKLLQSRKIM
ncbi:MAG: ABC-type cytochrome c biosis transport system permease component [Ignavibacteria bacterium]|nr:ABC-type cytochrome c biosis transport system permease component [Ignavibacteria bacterium]